MKLQHLCCAVLVLCLAVPAVHALQVDESPDTPLLESSFVDRVNALAKGQWRASADNGRLLHGLKRANVRELLGVADNDPGLKKQRTFSSAELAEPIPDEFDSAERWPDCQTIREIRDQSNCGSCWAIAAVGAMSDRYCVAHGVNVRLSTADLLSCCFMCGFGCKGGWPSAAWTWWVWMGITTEECQPYPFAPCGHHTEDSGKYEPCPSTIYDTPSCNTTCLDNSKQVLRLKGKDSYNVAGEADFQRELMTNGPFEVTMTVYEDFLAYKSGVYSYTTGSQLGGHAMRVVGWGVLDGVPYWKIANSWNVDWGDKGYILIRRGTDECGIEAGGTGGLPAAPERVVQPGPFRRLG